MRSLSHWLPVSLRSKSFTRVSQATKLALTPLEERAVPATFVVSNPSDDATATGPANSLRRAISDLSSSPDATNNITFLAGLTGNITLQNTLPTITKAVTIDGPGASILIAANQKAVFTVTDTAMASISVTINDISISNAKRTGNGAGLLVNSGNVTLNRVLISDSEATGTGGAISVGGGSLNLRDSILSGNTSGSNGGGVNNNGGVVSIDRSAILNSTTGAGALGGGIFQDSGTLNVKNSLIRENTTGFGGGMYVRNNSSVAVENSSLTKNTATSNGGGMRINVGAATVTFRNVTVAENTTVGDGGGVSVEAGTLISNNSTLANNSITGAAGKGGGLQVAAGSTAKLFSTLIANNTIVTAANGKDVNGAVDATSANNLIGLGTALTGITNGANANQVGSGAGIDARLLALETNGILQTIPLQSTSPAVDTGSNPTSLTTDNRSGLFVRSSGAGVDIGAFEFQADVPLVVNTNTDRNNPTIVAGDLSLREALRMAGNGAPVVTFAATMNGKSINLTQGSLLVGGAVSIAGPGAKLLTIDGGARDAALIAVDFQTSFASVTVSGVTVQNGASGSGGLFSGGGGIVSIENLTIDKSAISGNKSSIAGGGILSLSGVLTIKNSTISGNTSDGNGGGVYTTGGNVVISNSTISGNTARNDGGGVLFTSAGTLSLKNSTLTNNKADSDNSGGGKGGGIRMTAGTSEFISTIIGGNLVGTTGTILDVSGTAKLTKILVSNNTGLTLAAGSDAALIVANPQLGLLADNGGPTQTHALLAGSPAIDVGSNPDALTTDQRGTGFARVTGTSADIGAFEFGSVATVTNQNPVAANDTAGTGLNTAVIINVLANDSDPDSDPLAVTILTNPANGAVVVNADKTVTYTPTTGFSGTNTFTYQIADGKGGTASATVTVNVSATANKAPVAVNDTASTAFNTATNINVLANDSDGDNDPLTVTILTNPANGTVVVNADKTVRYTPTTGFSGTNTFTYQVADGKGGLATASVTVTVSAAVLTTGSSVTKEFTVGLDNGGGTVQLFNQDRSVRQTLTPFPGFTGGIRTVSADFNGDGVADIVVGTGPGIATRVKILSGVDTSSVLFDFAPFESAFTGGVFIAAGDINGDGTPDLAISPDEGGGPRVRIFNGKGFGQIVDYFGIQDPAFRGGARVTLGDIDGDGKAEIIVAAGFGGGPRITIWNGAAVNSSGGTPPDSASIANFFAFETALRNGSYVAAGDINGDGKADVVFGGGPGGAPRVRIFDGTRLFTGGFDNLDSISDRQLANFFAGDVNDRSGVRVTVKNLDNDGKGDLLAGGGPGSGSRVNAYSATNFNSPLFTLDAQSGFTGGVYVG